MTHKPVIGYAPELVEHLKGQRVRIPAGVPVMSTHPQEDGWRLTKRAQTVKVDHVLCGGEDGRGEYRRVLSDPCVRWPGAGGYWRWVPIQYVEAIAFTTKDERC